MNRFPRGGEFQPEGGAFAGRGAHLDLAGVFLDDAVAYREAQAGAASGGFGGEEGIEDARQIFARNARARVGRLRFRPSRCSRTLRTSSMPPEGMASRAFMKRFRKTCCRRLLEPSTGGRSLPDSGSPARARSGTDARPATAFPRSPDSGPLPGIPRRRCARNSAGC